jgi:hypothetical protein
MPQPVSALFVIHQFEVKSLECSAGYMEVAKPAIHSGLIGEHRILPFGTKLDDAEVWVDKIIDSKHKQWGRAPVVVYGAGAHTRKFLAQFRRLNVVALADREPALWDTQIEGLPVIAPEMIPHYAHKVVISSRAYEQSIQAQLDKLFDGQLELSCLYADTKDQHKLSLQSQIDRLLEDFQPDVLFYTPTHPQESLDARYFLSLKARYPSLNIVTIWWDYDEQAEAASYLDFERDMLRYSDFVIENSNVTRLQKLHARHAPYQHHTNVHKVHFHPTVFDPDLFYRDPAEYKTVDVAIWGSSVGMRQKWIDLLAASYQGFRQFGGVYQNDIPLSTSEYAAWYRKTKIAVNTQTYAFRSQCKGKVREALCSGTFLLEQDNPQTRGFVPEGKGVVYFSDEQDLLRKIDYYLAHEAEREQIALDGYKWMQQQHNAFTWTARILSELGLDHDVPKSRGDVFSDAL